jgi:hypothetical protein
VTIKIKIKVNKIFHSILWFQQGAVGFVGVGFGFRFDDGRNYLLFFLIFVLSMEKS